MHIAIHKSVFKVSITIALLHRSMALFVSVRLGLQVYSAKKTSTIVQPVRVQTTALARIVWQITLVCVHKDLTVSTVKTASTTAKNLIAPKMATASTYVQVSSATATVATMANTASLKSTIV